MSVLTAVSVLAMMVTVGVLVTGIWSMAHGGDFDKKHSDQLMASRVGAQAVTLILLLIAVYLANT